MPDHDVPDQKTEHQGAWISDVDRLRWDILGCNLMTGSTTLYADLRHLGLIQNGVEPAAQPLAGGVSSDIWKVELAAGPIVFKRALAKLKVAQDWRAPVDRSRFEIRWLRAVAQVLPEAVPQLIVADEDRGIFAIEYLDPQKYISWKQQLLKGHVQPATAAEVGRCLAIIHAATARDPAMPGLFASDAIFHEIRLAPYLEAAASCYPDLSEALQQLGAITARTKRALVHGDISPKNILIGPGGPVFLDAECAWFGDPAFDLAFCLNHILLKCLVSPAEKELLLDSFLALTGHYLDGVNWELPSELETRAAHLLPGLMLARVDGKSPVEYISESAAKHSVREVARQFLAAPVAVLGLIAAEWRRELRRC